ncbi:MAG: biopolymer transporter ExbD [Brevinematales bacterium]|nr:biopolymer transporter ExbD [Brevinematales bacterium]
MKRLKIGGKRVSTEIPTSSQSDIAFLLIIFFVITTSFALKTGLKLDMPKKTDTVKTVSMEQIDKVLITQDAYLINGKKTELQGLADAILALNRPNLLIEVRKGVKYQHVLDFIGLIPASGANISVRMEK